MFDGDSLTDGTYGGGTAYPAKVIAAIDLAIGNSEAIGGQTLADMQSTATDVDAHYTDHRLQNPVVVAWGGTNDLFFGASAATTITRLQTYCNARRAIGWKVAVFTILPRSDPGTPGTFGADRATVNASIRANWATYADYLVDVAADSRLDDETDTTYFHTDLVHLSDAGRQVVADLVVDALT